MESKTLLQKIYLIISFIVFVVGTALIDMLDFKNEDNDE